MIIPKLMLDYFDTYKKVLILTFDNAGTCSRDGIFP